MTANTNKGMIAWFAKNPVAANLLMMILIIGGLFSVATINKEIFPRFDLNYISVRVSYPGAAPQEVEEGITVKIEEAIEDVVGIKRLTSNASEGSAYVSIEVEEGYSTPEVLDEIKIRIDGISTFPDNMEKPNIYQIKPEADIVWVAIYGSAAERTLKEVAKDLRDELVNLPEVTRANVVAIRGYEIGINVSEDKLREYGLTFSQVAQAVRASSVDLPGGSIRAEDGDILLRTKGQAYTGADFANIVVKTQPDGSRIMLPQVANINDGFEERLEYSRFNGEPAALISISAVDDQDAIAISEQVNAAVEQYRAQLPSNVKIDTWGDSTYYLEGRLNMMIESIVMGSILVFIVLAIFLELKLAFWVMLGLPICFLGALMFMPTGPIGLTINLLTLFAFILVLGIVVDDAIVIGESAYAEIESKGHTLDNVIAGCQRVAMPATFGVLTTIAAFMPMLMVSGPFGIIWQSIGAVVILCLAFSLVESKLILPAHLAHMRARDPNKPLNIFSRTKKQFNARYLQFVHTKYRAFLTKAIEYRYSVLASFVGILMLSFAAVHAGFIKTIFFPSIPSDFIQINLDMENGSSEENTLATVIAIEKALYQMDAELQKTYGESVIKHSFINMDSRTSAFIMAELSKGESREIDGVEIAEAWRNALPELVMVKSIDINASTNDGGGDIAFRFEAENLEELSLAADELKAQLETYDGIYEISDNLSSSSQEIRLQIRPEAEAIGLTLSDLAQQVRYGFYGFEAQRILRNKEEVKVMVRYPLAERRTIGHLENMMIRTPAGEAVPFSTVAEIELADSYAAINRVNGRRAVTVYAGVNKEKAEPGKIMEEINQAFMPALQARYPSIRTELDGQSKEEAEAMSSLAQGFVMTMFVIYALMAIPLKSYGQPLIIMSVIPFGIIGAFFGHWVMDLPLNVLSICGIVALTGVVVNDSLILVDFVSQARAKGQALLEAAVDASCHRFRAITLTSLTTFVGLIPILMEKSLQAQIVIPMATSLAFGILFATCVTLILVPSLYLIMDDLRHGSGKLWQLYWHGKKTSEQPLEKPLES